MQLECNCTQEYATGKTQENWSKLPICLYVVEDNGLSCGPFVRLEGVGFVSYLMKSTCHLSASKSNKTSWVHSVLRQTCSIVSAKPSLTSNSAVVEQNHFHKDYHCVCFSSYIFFCAVSCSCIPVAFQLQIPVANSISIGGNIRKLVNHWNLTSN